MRKKLNYILLALFILTISVTAVFFSARKSNDLKNINLTANNDNQNSRMQPELAEKNFVVTPPISNALARVLKKPFGIKVSPNSSPVSPERFFGYHTGVDFEVFEPEENIEAPIYVICDGPLLLKKFATGYGGVAVQQCKINETDVTIIYGHLKLDSISIKLNQQITAGEQIGSLGKGFSAETDGERKHLHLGIHKGTEINLRGYAQTPAELDDWIDVLTLLK